MRKKSAMFDCPVCGNPLIKSKRYAKIRCIYCGHYTDVPGFESKKEEHKDDRSNA
jgi:uncharacterized Zn finger protein (UPF0148 family)